MSAIKAKRNFPGWRTPGNIIQYINMGAYINGSGSGLNTSIVNPQDGDILVYDSGVWKNTSMPLYNDGSDIFIISDTSISTYNLSNNPIEGSVAAHINGLEIIENIDFTIDYLNGKITLSSGVELGVGDTLYVKYKYI